MHGLIFNMSISSLAGSTRYLQEAKISKNFHDSFTHFATILAKDAVNALGTSAGGKTTRNIALPSATLNARLQRFQPRLRPDSWKETFRITDNCLVGCRRQGQLHQLLIVSGQTRPAAILALLPRCQRQSGPGGRSKVPVAVGSPRPPSPIPRS